MKPVHVDDLAALAVEFAHGTGNVVVDAVAPESFSYRELVATIGGAIGQERPLLGGLCLGLA